MFDELPIRLGEGSVRVLNMCQCVAYVCSHIGSPSSMNGIHTLAVSVPHLSVNVLYMCVFS
jgi:hypothetical protein